MFNTEQCPYCGEQYVEYGNHIRTRHTIGCSEVRKKFNNYSEGLLKEEDDERVICHLADCESCSEALQKFIDRKLQMAQ